LVIGEGAIYKIYRDGDALIIIIGKLEAEILRLSIVDRKCFIFCIGIAERDFYTLDRTSGLIKRSGAYLRSDLFHSARLCTRDAS